MTAEVEFKGEALFKAIASIHIHRIDTIQTSFGSAQHLRGEEWAREMVFVTVLLRDGDDGRDDELLGAAFVRSDPQVAAVRATLDGLTRRLAPYLDD